MRRLSQGDKARISAASLARVFLVKSHCGVFVFVVGTMPAGQGTPPGLVPEGFCAVPLLVLLAVDALALAPLAEAWPAMFEFPLVFSPVGAFAPAALTQGAPVVFMFGFVVVALPGA